MADQYYSQFPRDLGHITMPSSQHLSSDTVPPIFQFNVSATRDEVRTVPRSSNEHRRPLLADSNISQNPNHTVLDTQEFPRYQYVDSDVTEYPEDEEDSSDEEAIENDRQQEQRPPPSPPTVKHQDAETGPFVPRTALEKARAAQAKERKKAQLAMEKGVDAATRQIKRSLGPEPTPKQLFAHFVGRAEASAQQGWSSITDYEAYLKGETKRIKDANDRASRRLLGSPAKDTRKSPPRVKRKAGNDVPRTIPVDGSEGEAHQEGSRSQSSRTISPEAGPSTAAPPPSIGQQAKKRKRSDGMGELQSSLGPAWEVSSTPDGRRKRRPRSSPNETINQKI